MEKKKLYSYIKNPFCKNGWLSLGLSLTAFIITQAVCFFAVKNAGAVNMTTAAFSISAMLIDIVSFVFIVLSFKEKNKNYIFAVIALVMSIFVLAQWAYVFTK